MNGNNLKSIPPSLRPREKALRFGIDQLSNIELLALILNQGIKGKSVLDIAFELFNHRGWTFLHDSANQFRSIKGLKEAQWVKIMALGEIAKRVEQEKKLPIRFVKDAKDIYDLFQHYFLGLGQEQVLLIGLNAKNGLIFEKVIFQGTHQTVLLESSLIFGELFKHHCSRFILVHNHPSGVVEPSQEDIQTTQVLKKQSKHVGLTLLDHIILAPPLFYSMAKHELI